MTSLDKFVAGFTTTPFLFIGSGITRRYFSLPDWKTLLETFVSRVNGDAFAFLGYEDSAKRYPLAAGIYPKIASLLETDFNDLWFNNKIERSMDEYCLKEILNGCSPFKAEVASYIKNISKLVDTYSHEVDLFNQLTLSSVSGLITTNYDNFLEYISDGYSTYIGQEELIFSPIQGIAEIYKIHGCVSRSSSIVITEEDYVSFESNSPYLAAKLMTIFMEYPIIFLGYSISDSNIQNILESIVKCLSPENLQKLSNRFLFVEYNPSAEDIQLSHHTMNFNGKLITMTKAIVNEFTSLYSALLKKKKTLPVKLLRHFKQEYYNYVLTNTPTSCLRVSEIDDARLKDEDLVLAIGRLSEMGITGLTGITCDDWHKNIGDSRKQC